MVFFTLKILNDYEKNRTYSDEITKHKHIILYIYILRTI